MLISVFDIFCPAELFRDVQPLVQSALDGYNVSIFAYGQTHSGKTHTMVALFLSIYLVVGLSHIFHCVLTLLSCGYMGLRLGISWSNIRS